MLYQDRRALSTVARGIMWLASVIAPLPLLVAVPFEVLAVAVLGACAALIVVYAMLLVTIR